MNTFQESHTTPANICTEFQSGTENLRSPISSMEDNQNL